MRCPNCGHIFGAENLVKVNGPTSATVTITDSHVNCPRCGAWADQIQEGTFDVAPDGTWRHLAAALRTPDATAEDYRQLAELLRHARSAGAPQEQVADEIATTTPVFGGLADFLKSPQMQGLAMWITVLLMVLSLYITYLTLEETEHAPPVPAPAPAPVVNVRIDQPSEQQIEQWIAGALRQTQGDTSSPARNRPCVCGSGKKFKKCCGAPGGPLHR